MSAPGRRRRSLGIRQGAGLRLAAAMVLGSLGLGGCAHLPDVGPLGATPAERLDGLVQAHRYDEALALLDRLDPEAPETPVLVARRAALEAARQSWVEALIERARKARDEGAWVEAVEAVEEGLAALPDDPRLAAVRGEVISARDAYLQGEAHRLRMAEARYLIERLPGLERMVAAWPDHRGNDLELRRARERARELSDLLLEAGEAAWAAGTPDASEILALAHRLHARERSGELLAQIGARQRARERARLAAARDRHEARVAHWREVFEDAMTRDDPVRAREAIDALAAMTPEPDGIGALRERLEARNLEVLTAGVARGRQLYGQGDIRGALEAWEAVAPLAPEDVVLAGYIARARRFLENLERHDPEGRTVRAGDAGMGTPDPSAPRPPSS